MKGLLVILYLSNCLFIMEFIRFHQLIQNGVRLKLFHKLIVCLITDYSIDSKNGGAQLQPRLVHIKQTRKKSVVICPFYGSHNF